MEQVALARFCWLRATVQRRGRVMQVMFALRATVQRRGWAKVGVFGWCLSVWVLIRLYFCYSIYTYIIRKFDGYCFRSYFPSQNCPQRFLKLLFCPNLSCCFKFTGVGHFWTVSFVGFLGSFRAMYPGRLSALNWIRSRRWLWWYVSFYS